MLIDPPYSSAGSTRCWKRLGSQGQQHEINIVTNVVSVTITCEISLLGLVNLPSRPSRERHRLYRWKSTTCNPTLSTTPYISTSLGVRFVFPSIPADQTFTIYKIFHTIELTADAALRVFGSGEQSKHANEISHFLLQVPSLKTHKSPHTRNIPAIPA